MKIFRTDVYLALYRAFILFFSLAGCSGYHLVGTQTLLPEHIKSISIPIFANHTLETKIDVFLTDAVKERFLLDGRIRLTDSADADAELIGTVNKFERVPLSFDEDDNVLEYRVEIEIFFQLRDKKKGGTIVSRNLNARWDYDVSDVLSRTEMLKENSIKNASRDFAETLFNIIMEGF